MIIGTERHESRRIDNQLRGRAGRQGDQVNPDFIFLWKMIMMRLFWFRKDSWASSIL